MTAGTLPSSRWLGGRRAGFCLLAAALALALAPEVATAQQAWPTDADSWLRLRNGPLQTYGAWAIGGVVVLLASFLFLRGRVRIEKGWAGRTIARFNGIERFGHWLLAVSFMALALTGLNGLYGERVLLPLVGSETFASITAMARWLHRYVAFGFMAGLALTFLLWLPHSLPSWRDVVWLLKGGGLFVRGSHTPAWKFNAGQKFIFWCVLLGGVVLSLTGLVMMFPSQTPLVAKTFAFVNMAGFKLPADLTTDQALQYAAAAHSLVALGLVVIVIAHIYIGTVGMQGAFSAMGTGQVDVNWAKEHHSLWAEREIQRMEEAAAAETNAARLAPAE